MRFLFFLILLLSLMRCEEGEELRRKQTQNNLNFLLILAKSRMDGNCLKTVTDSTTSKKSYFCSLRPSGLCTINLSLITQGEVTYAFRESKKVTDRTADCQESLAQSGIFSLKASTTKEEEDFKLNTEYKSVVSCEAENFTLKANVRLATNEEILFFESARGKIGRSASFLSTSLFLPKVNKDRATSCLESAFTESEKDLFKNLSEGKILIEVSK